MAASDQTYRNQYRLDLVFGVSSTLMLLSVIWMFVQDFNREFKTEQRAFRDVEVPIAQRLALESLPSLAEFNAAEKAVTEARTKHEAHKTKITELRNQIKALLPDKERSEAKFQAIKSDLESRLSFYDLEVENKGGVTELAQRYLTEAKGFADDLEKEQGKRDDYVGKIRDLRTEADALEKNLTEKLSTLKKLNDKFDAQVKIAVNKQWNWTDSVRNLPIIDGFASPIKIHQITNNDIPIDYNFKYVTRFDRCMSCHISIDRPTYTKEMLRSLVTMTDTQKLRLDEARTLLLRRRETLAGLPDAKALPEPEQLDVFRLSASQMSESRVTEFAAHPRLDLFVGGTSKHPVERFGCSSCHSGQGSATSFTLASHSPNDPAAKERWVAEHGWEHIHMWDFPMMPKRFTESSCLKCHYEVTDLYASDGRVEAPKLLRGYNIIREFGCFGCHEIQGRKGGRDIGPDLRLEPSPPLEAQSPVERAKAESDPDNRPGRIRKVGPSLMRLSEKTHAEWLAKWLRAPREFRPDTKMPHFYGLSNNDAKNLPDTQKEFPETEIWAVTNYLLNASRQNLAAAEALRADLRQKDGPAKAQADEALVQMLLAKGKLEIEDKQAFDAAQRRISLRAMPPLVDHTPGYSGDPDHGRILFSERGCLACHSHVGTTRDDDGRPVTAIIRKNYEPTRIPAVVSDAQFGPNLSQLTDKFLSAATQAKLDAAKLKRVEPAKKLAAADKERDAAQRLYDFAKETFDKSDVAEKDKQKPGLEKASDRLAKAKAEHAKRLADYQAVDQPFMAAVDQKDVKAARVWLTQWILDPHVHSPRSRMPETHLTPLDADDVATWLLSQPAQDVGAKWSEPAPAKPDEKSLKALAQVYLTRILSKSDMDKLLAGQGKLSETVINDLPAEEKELAKNFSDVTLERYVGKKAVARLGCFACHDIPGTESIKPIGVGLNDWGKKPADRLAFEDIANFLKKSYHVVDSLTDAQGKPNAHADDGKPPYEKFFAELLDHHHRAREGYLHQKIVDPRSYDYLRVKSWDDRARMPQFKFARIHKKTGETDRDFEARSYKEEADAREAVMTFILGLVAEQVPTKSINLPTGDRLAEVKGRQVLDNFNCAGCHLIRPGVYDFKVNRDMLKSWTENAEDALKNPKKHTFLNHHMWTGAMPATTDKTTAYGLIQTPIQGDDAAGEAESSKEDATIPIRLSYALRFSAGKKGTFDLPGADRIFVAVKDMIAPGPNVARDQERLERFIRERGQLGGAFSDLLTRYMFAKNPKDFKLDNGDVPRARLTGPPSLIGQGERTQADWLYQFLLDPYPVRKMSVVRMPKFNMSKTDAQALVDYFGAVERMHNSGVGPSYPYEMIHQQDPANESFWRVKTQEYVQRLKNTTVNGGKSALDKKIEELTPVWRQIQKDVEAQHADAKAKFAGWETRAKASDATAAAAQKEGGDAAGAKALKDVADADEKQLGIWRQEVERLSATLADASVEKQKTAWMEKEAYITDAYRLVMNRTLCLQCHSIGSVETINEVMGPPLTGVHKRLRPGWVERWVALPERFLPYASSMPENFPPKEAGKANEPDAFKQYFVGSPLDRIQAARDVLMILPRASAMPVNRYWVLPPAPASEKTPANEKTGEMK